MDGAGVEARVTYKGQLGGGVSTVLKSSPRQFVVIIWHAAYVPSPMHRQCKLVICKVSHLKLEAY